MTIEVMETEAAQERLERILHPMQGQAASTQPTQPPAPNRKPRSDKGIPKKPPADPDEITLKMNLPQAREVAISVALRGHDDLCADFQDQIIKHLQKRIDSLTKQK